jgi:hypothetical protein
MIGAVRGVLVGVLFLLASCAILFWNEGRAVERMGALEAGRDAVVTVAADPVVAANEGELVFVTGQAAGGGQISDPDLGVITTELRLRRIVEMRQWEEDVTEPQSSSTTKTKTYSYWEVWSDEPLDSADYHELGHDNPPMPIRGDVWDQGAVSVGGFKLNAGLVRQIDNWEPLPAGEQALPTLRARFGSAQAHGNGLYVGSSPENPSVGDLRIRFEQAPAAQVSIVGRQSAEGFGPWTTPADSVLEERLEVGVLTAEQMFESLEAENTAITWLVRVLGFVFMFVAFKLMLRPLSAASRLVPVVGRVAGFAATMVSFLLACVLTLGIVAVAWVFHRPVLGLGLLATAIVPAAVLVLRGRFAK